MVFERPRRKEHPPQAPATEQASPATKRSTSGQPNKVTTSGGGSGSGNDRPSPWLNHPLHLNGHSPHPDSSASFVEYLRWMRSPDSSYKDPTKVQILQMAEENANYCERLTQLTERTKLIAGEGNYFHVKCAWRIRVGGHRGPESILLPAFDALGMPYIPASTLRGVARTQAIQHFTTEQSMTRQQAEQQVARYFGSLEAEESNRAGKVIFLDAYPIPNPSNKSGGLAVDIANNIWSWNDDQLNYSPNPNPFFSLKESTFLIGIRRSVGCDDDTLIKVKQWLSAGLQVGIGSQVNIGYGKLVRAGQGKTSNQFFQVEFSLEGQLIHGRQKFTQWNWHDRRQEWQMRGQPDAEVRPVAFKSMLRYWFRAFALGVMLPNEVKTWEATLFGAINPQKRGWVTVQISQGEVVRREARSNNDPCGEQAGIMVLNYSFEAPQSQHSVIKELLVNLVWLMFHLGGIGQGARRPCYSRKTRGQAPWWRGSTLIPHSEDKFWQLPNTVGAFQQRFRQRLQSFYAALAKLTGRSINLRSLHTTGQVRSDRWVEAVDSHCRIVVCAGDAYNKKPYALSVLHDPAFKRGQDYDGNLCGKVVREVKPSPVWVADLGDYQVVTIFGATEDPRKKYLQELRTRTSRENYAQIFPLV